MTLDEYLECLVVAGKSLSDRYAKVESKGTDWASFIFAEHFARGAELYCDGENSGFTVALFTGEEAHEEHDRRNLDEALIDIMNWLDSGEPPNELTQE